MVLTIKVSFSHVEVWKCAVQAHSAPSSCMHQSLYCFLAYTRASLLLLFMEPFLHLFWINFSTITHRFICHSSMMATLTYNLSQVLLVVTSMFFSFLALITSCHYTYVCVFNVCALTSSRRRGLCMFICFTLTYSLSITVPLARST